MDFCLLLKPWVKILVKNICKNLSSKYSQKSLNHAKKSATDAFKTASKRAIQKTAEAIVDFIGNKIDEAVAKSYVGRITKVLKNYSKIIQKQ